LKARAYCSSANLGPGFDLVAAALDAFYDEVSVVDYSKASKPEVVITDIKGPYGEDLSKELNTAKRAVEYMLKEKKLPYKVYLELWKGIPVEKGLGSSGASAAAAVLAVSKALGIELSPEEAIKYAGEGELVSAGIRHYESVAASYLGHIVVLYSFKPLKVFKIKPPVEPLFLIVLPEVKAPLRKTSIVRSIIPKKIPLEIHVRNAGRLAALIYGLTTGNLKVLGEGMFDEIVEPAREVYVPLYRKIREVALTNGAKGAAISGAGPSLLILVDEQTSSTVEKAVKEVYENEGISVKIKQAHLAPPAHIIE